MSEDEVKELSTAQKIFNAAKKVQRVKAGLPPEENQEGAEKPTTTKPSTVAATDNTTEEMTQEKLEKILDTLLHTSTTKGQSTLKQDQVGIQKPFRPGRRPRWAGRLGK